MWINIRFTFFDIDLLHNFQYVKRITNLIQDHYLWKFYTVETANPFDIAICMSTDAISHTTSKNTGNLRENVGFREMRICNIINAYKIFQFLSPI